MMEITRREAGGLLSVRVPVDVDCESTAYRRAIYELLRENGESDGDARRGVGEAVKAARSIAHRRERRLPPVQLRPGPTRSRECPP